MIKSRAIVIVQDMHSRWKTLSDFYGKSQRCDTASWLRQANAAVVLLNLKDPNLLIDPDRAAI